MRKRAIIEGLCGALCLAFSLTACSEYYRVARLGVGERRAILIFAERYYENEQALYYEVEEGGRNIVPRTYISSIDPEDVSRTRFRVISDGGTVYGVVAEALPQKIWLLHDFSSGGTWPRCESGGFEHCEEVGQSLLRKIQQNHPEVKFTL